MITLVNDVSVVSIVGQDLSTFHKPYNALIKNQIVPLLFNNTVSGKNVSLVLKKSDLNKALNVMHGQIFGISKKVNLAIFGNKRGIPRSWKSSIETKGIKYKVEDIFEYAKANHLENLIVVDNTASEDFVANYFDFVENGFDLVSSSMKLMLVRVYH